MTLRKLLRWKHRYKLADEDTIHSHTLLQALKHPLDAAVQLAARALSAFASNFNCMATARCHAWQHCKARARVRRK